MPDIHTKAVNTQYVYSGSKQNLPKGNLRLLTDDQLWNGLTPQIICDTRWSGT